MGLYIPTDIINVKSYLLLSVRTLLESKKTIVSNDKIRVLFVSLDFTPMYIRTHMINSSCTKKSRANIVTVQLNESSNYAIK